MCECGCGDFHPYKAFKIGDLILAVEVYKGCKYCHHGIGIWLHVFTPEQAASWDIENPVKLNPADLNPGRHGPNQTGFSLLMVDDLRAWFSEDGRDMPLDDDYNLEWLIEEHGLEILQAAVRARLKKNDEET